MTLNGYTAVWLVNREMNSRWFPLINQNWPAYLKSWVHRFTFQRQNGKGALMYPPQRFAFHKPLQGFNTQGELAQGK